MTLEDIYKDFKEKDKAAENGGGEKAIAKQKKAGKQTARERINMLLDDDTFVEIDKFVLHDSHNYNMQNNSCLLYTSLSSSDELECITPPPASITGFLQLSIISDAFFT